MNVILTDKDLCALQYALDALKAIAERGQLVGDVVEPLNDIRKASARARQALIRFEPVVIKINDSGA